MPVVGDPAGGGMRGDAQDVHCPGLDLHDEQHIQATQTDRVEVEEVCGDQTRGLGAQELLPGRVRPPRGWTDSTALKDPDRAGTNAVTHSGEFTLDPSMAPGGVFAASRSTKSRTSSGMGGRPDRLG